MPGQETRLSWNRPVDGMLAALVAAQGPVLIWLLPGLIDGLAALVMWLVCLLLIGVPLLWFEMGLGSCLQVGLPAALWRSDKRWAWLGWSGSVLLLVQVVLAVAAMAVLGATGVNGLVAEEAQGQVWSGKAAELSVPISAMILIIVLAGAAGMVALLRAGPRHLGPLLRWSVPVLLLLALASLFLLAIHPEGRSGMIKLLRWDGGQFSDARRWLAMAALVTVSIIGACGLHTGLAAQQARRSDIGAQVPLIIAAAALGHILTAFLVAGMTGTAAWHPGPDGLPQQHAKAPGLWIVMGGGGVGRILGCLTLGLMAFLVASIGMQVLQVVWRQVGGMCTLLAQSRRVALVCLLALVFLTGDALGKWVLLQQLIFAIGVVYMPMLTAIYGSRRTIMGGVEDHIRAYSTIQAWSFWRVILVIVIPAWAAGQLAALTTVGSSGVAFWLQPVFYVFWLGLAVATVFLHHRPLRRFLVVRQSRLSAWMITLAVGVLVMLHIAQRPQRSISRDVQLVQSLTMQGQAMPDSRYASHPSRIISRAVHHQRWHDAQAAADLWARSRAQLPGSHDDGVYDLLVDRLVAQAEREFARLPSDRDLVLHLVGVLRQLRADAGVRQIIAGIDRADWFPAAWIGELQVAVQLLDLAETPAEAREAFASVRAVWRRLDRMASGGRDPQLLHLGPPVLSRAIGDAEAVLVKRFRCSMQAEGGDVLLARDIAATMQELGIWQRVEADLQADWYRRFVPERASVTAVATVGVLSLLLSLGIVIIVLRMQKGVAVFDPSAETLAHVEAIDFDTQAVTLSAAFSTDLNIVSNITTPVGDDTDESEHGGAS